eukprot:CAMPEP_0196670890 /NCGR_PEP_ID=MMETSP1090-20130531/1492_1 /TAXON_ID=37098 /ORGANISM="Isochrysis sp, Strain CCMP1244" /LENGTH=259 /DNA_ID=CAMNT_0042008513 /DNA_START=177 /DNA_END=953 /DNA_ORIENTATION=+
MCHLRACVLAGASTWAGQTLSISLNRGGEGWRHAVCDVRCADSGRRVESRDREARDGGARWCCCGSSAAARWSTRGSSAQVRVALARNPQAKEEVRELVGAEDVVHVRVRLAGALGKEGGGEVVGVAGAVGVRRGGKAAPHVRAGCSAAFRGDDERVAPRCRSAVGMEDKVTRTAVRPRRALASDLRGVGRQPGRLPRRNVSAPSRGEDVRLAGRARPGDPHATRRREAGEDGEEEQSDKPGHADPSDEVAAAAAAAAA